MVRRVVVRVRRVGRCILVAFGRDFWFGVGCFDGGVGDVRFGVELFFRSDRYFLLVASRRVSEVTLYERSRRSFTSFCIPQSILPPAVADFSFVVAPVAPGFGGRRSGSVALGTPGILFSHGLEMRSSEP